MLPGKNIPFSFTVIVSVSVFVDLNELLGGSDSFVDVVYTGFGFLLDCPVVASV